MPIMTAASTTPLLSTHRSTWLPTTVPAMDFSTPTAMVYLNMGWTSILCRLMLTCRWIPQQRLKKTMMGLMTRQPGRSTANALTYRRKHHLQSTRRTSSTMPARFAIQRITSTGCFFTQPSVIWTTTWQKPLLLRQKSAPHRRPTVVQQGLICDLQFHQHTRGVFQRPAAG